MEKQQHMLIDTPKAVPVMLDEPNYSNDFELDNDSISKLSGKFWVSTKVVDFLIKSGIPYSPEENIIIPTTLVEQLLKVYLFNIMSPLPQHKEFYKTKFNEFQYFGLKPFQIYLCSCVNSHFFVISLTLDVKNPDGKIFYNIEIYDSLKPSICKNKSRVCKTPPSINFLKDFQKFVAQYILYGTDIGTKLLMDPDYILDMVTYHTCP